MRREACLDWWSRLAPATIRWLCGSALLLLGVTCDAAEGWTATSLANAPSGRIHHTAVWTGSKMIVWGGTDWFNTAIGTRTGGVYDPARDTWAATSTANAPSGRRGHTAVWTGSKMIVWGGRSSSLSDAVYFNTGGIYDPATNSWTATSTTNAPSARDAHTAVWTGSRMIVWGGGPDDSVVDTGGIYDPVSDTWTATNTLNAPLPRGGHTAVWTGSKMIVWGGGPLASVGGTGGIYDPATGTWTETSTLNTPRGRGGHTALWTGTRMIIWGGGRGLKGGTYDPASDTWTELLSDVSGVATDSPTAVRAGSSVILWGGFDGRYVNTGGMYDSATDTWYSLTQTDAPSARIHQTAVWTGSSMIVWGGMWADWQSTDLFNTGAVYAFRSRGSPLRARSSRWLALVDRCGIPDGTNGLAVNLAVTKPTASGNLRVYPGGIPAPTVSSINYSAGQTRANNAIVKTNDWGEVEVRSDQASGTVHFILDVNGYFDSSGSFFTLKPCRAVDTRTEW